MCSLYVRGGGCTCRGLSILPMLSTHRAVRERREQIEEVQSLEGDSHLRMRGHS